MAKTEVVGGVFQCMDVLEYDFPQKSDIVFAFASLLHMNKDNLKQVLDTIHNNLNPDGIVFLSLKHRTTYSSELITDQHSARTFYYYNKKTIAQLTNGLYSESFYEEQILKEPWFTMILKKNDI